MKRNVFLVALRQQQTEVRRLGEAIWKNLQELGYGDH